MEDIFYVPCPPACSPVLKRQNAVIEEPPSIVSSLLKPEESRGPLDYINLSKVTLSKCEDIFNTINTVIVNRTYNKKTPFLVYEIMLGCLEGVLFDIPVYRNLGDHLGSAASILKDFKKKFKDLEKSIDEEILTIDLEKSKKIFEDSNDFLFKIQNVYASLYNIKMSDIFSL